MIKYLRSKMTFGRFLIYKTKLMQLMLNVTRTGTLLTNVPAVRNFLADFCRFEICSFGHVEPEWSSIIFALEKTAVKNEVLSCFDCVGLGMDSKI
jgi:hypothetical protein